MALNAQALASACPCGRTGATKKPLPLAQCCGRYVQGESCPPAPDAESLMRSRYSAFVLGLEAYLLATWHSSTRPPEAVPEPGTKWLGLEVRNAARSVGRVDGGTAEVEFVARYRVAGRAVRLHERSRFVHEGGRWYYVDGDML